MSKAKEIASLLVVMAEMWEGERKGCIYIGEQTETSIMMWKYMAKEFLEETTKEAEEDILANRYLEQGARL